MRKPTRAGKENTLSRLRGCIKSANLVPGDRLPPERELAAFLNVSRGQLRQAMDVLHKERRILRHVGKGTFLGEGDAWSPDFSLTIPELSNPLEVFEARLAIEPVVAGMAATRGSKRDLIAVQKSWERGRDLSTYTDIQEFNTRLHLAIAQAAQSKILLEFVKVLYRIMEETHWGLLVPQTKREAFQEAWAEHGDLVLAITQRDSTKARHLMEAHIRNIRQIVAGDF